MAVHVLLIQSDAAGAEVFKKALLRNHRFEIDWVQTRGAGLDVTDRLHAVSPRIPIVVPGKGCAAAQGDYFGRPLQPRNVAELARRYGGAASV